MLKYSTPVAAKLLAISLVVMTAATGWPLPIGLPIVTISGITPEGEREKVVYIYIYTLHSKSVSLPTMLLKGPEVSPNPSKTRLNLISNTESTSCPYRPTVHVVHILKVKASPSQTNSLIDTLQVAFRWYNNTTTTQYGLRYERCYLLMKNKFKLLLLLYTPPHRIIL